MQQPSVDSGGSALRALAMQHCVRVLARQIGFDDGRLCGIACAQG
jgi:hypothetical protein